MTGLARGVGEGYSDYSSAEEEKCLKQNKWRANAYSIRKDPIKL